MKQILDQYENNSNTQFPYNLEFKRVYAGQKHLPVVSIHSEMIVPSIQSPMKTRSPPEISYTENP
jgi:hypothetical protein